MILPGVGYRSRFGGCEKIDRLPSHAKMTALAKRLRRMKARQHA